MADLTAEFWQAAALTLTSWTFGVILFRMGCRDWQARFLSRALLALSPIVMTCFGFHAVRENQELAAIIAARKGEAVDDRVYLASITRSDLGDGVRIEWEHYTNAGRSIRVEVSPGTDVVEKPHGAIADDAERTGSTARRTVPLSTGMRFGGNTYASDAVDGRIGLGIAF